MKNFIRTITDIIKRKEKEKEKEKEPVVVHEKNDSKKDDKYFKQLDYPISIWDYQEMQKDKEQKEISTSKTVDTKTNSNTKSSALNSVPYIYRRDIKVEKNVKVNIIFFDAILSNEEVNKYTNYVFNNYIGYFVLLRRDGVISKCLSNSLSSKDKNIEYATEFLNNKSTLDINLAFKDVFNLINGIESRIIVPNMITISEAKKEQEEYANKYAERKKVYDEEIRKYEEEEKAAREEERKRREEERKELNNKLKELNNSTPKVLNTTEPFPPKETSNSFEKLYQDKTGSVPKKKRKPRPIYPIWNFKPSKPIYDVSIDSVSFVGSCEIAINQENISRVKELKKLITPFAKKNIEFDFYSTTDKNTETLSLLGFKRIELLYEKYE